MNVINREVGEQGKGFRLQRLRAIKYWRMVELLYMQQLNFMMMYILNLLKMMEFQTSRR